MMTCQLNAKKPESHVACCCFHVQMLDKWTSWRRNYWTKFAKFDVDANQPQWHSAYLELLVMIN